MPWPNSSFGFPLPSSLRPFAPISPSFLPPTPSSLLSATNKPPLLPSLPFSPLSTALYSNPPLSFLEARLTGRKDNSPFVQTQLCPEQQCIFCLVEFNKRSIFSHKLRQIPPQSPNLVVGFPPPPIFQFPLPLPLFSAGGCLQKGEEGRRGEGWISGGGRILFGFWDFYEGLWLLHAVEQDFARSPSKKEGQKRRRRTFSEPEILLIPDYTPRPPPKKKLGEGKAHDAHATESHSFTDS